MTNQDWHHIVSDADLEGNEAEADAQQAMAREEAWAFATIKDFETVCLEQGLVYVKKMMDPSILNLLTEDN